VRLHVHEKVFETDVDAYLPESAHETEIDEHEELHFP
jgi:hypothetical protein